VSGDSRREFLLMKTATKITLSLISSAVLIIAASWIYLGHFLGPKIITEQNVSLVMWSATGIGAAMIVALSVVFYRVIR
jgi:hypothetical protein